MTPAPEEICVARDRQLSWGQNLAEGTSSSLSSSPTGSPLKPSVSTATFATVATSASSEESAALFRLKETLRAIPSRGYVSEKAPTPIEHMARLTKLCDGPELYVKRDDLLPLAGGGSKTRKLGRFDGGISSFCESPCDF